MAVVCDHGAYRDARSALIQCYGELRTRRLRECADLDPNIPVVVSRRMGRVFAGIALAAGASGVLGAGVVLTLSGSLFRVGDYSPRALGAALIGVWGLGAVAYLVGLHYGAAAVRSALAKYLQTTSDLTGDIERLRKIDPTSRVLVIAHRLERPALDWFMVGAALCLPLLLHGVVWMTGSCFTPALYDFGVWVALSSVLVGHCHLVFAHRAFGFGRALIDPSRQMPREPVVATIGACMGASLVPGLVLLALPTVLVGLTAAVATPLLYGWASRTVERERALLAQ